MNQTKFLACVKKYEEYLKKDLNDQPDESVRRERIEYYQNYTQNKIMNMTEEEYTEYIGKLWASAVYGNKKYVVDKMIEKNDGFTNLKKLLVEFIYGSEKIESRWDKFLSEAMYFGPSYMSEILGYVYPNEYALSNSQVIKALEYLEFPKMPQHNYQYTGKMYLEICKYVKEIQVLLKQKGINADNLLSVDYFLWEVALISKELTVVDSQPKSTEVSIIVKNRSIHSEIIEKIVSIGTMLGFSANSEVRVAKGAIVDAVWEVNIGNMGRVIYVFEVQSKGSIDSLILNLQKASNNKAVQALVAVSDEDQLNKIKEEADPLKKQVDIKLWDIKSVIEVFDNLSKAFEAINKLELVPKGL